MNSLKFLITILLTKLCFCAQNVEVKLKQGVLLGNVEKTLYKGQEYFAFRGVPYAESPTGELRFQPPIPHSGWTKRFRAYNHKPTCIQYSTRGRNDEPLGISGSEDCLYINIFTPNVEGTAPVIVFDYNDSFRTWFNGTDTYSPDFFIEEGVIVVTISSRLGVFGYLTTEDDVIPGNNGLRDFILGLEWVQNNIEQFGGDPSRVTLMGSRGGGTIADVLLYSTKAKGLFAGAILQSGTSFESLYFFENPREKAFKLAEFLNMTASNSNELLEQLQNANATKILDAEFKVLLNLDEKGQSTRFPFTPSVEYGTADGVITTLPEDGEIVNDVPVIIGFNSKEGYDLISQYLSQPKLLREDHADKILNLPIRTNFRFEPGSAKFKEANKEILQFYLKGKEFHYMQLLEYAVYSADYLQNYALNLAAETLSKKLSSSVFYYVFDYRGQWNENLEYIAKRSMFNFDSTTGATIIDELCYLFVCSRIKKTYEQLLNLPSEQPELKVTKKMVRLWSNFAKSGNPTPDKNDAILKNFTWEPFSNATESKYLHITKVLRMKTNPLGDRKKFWDEFLAKYSKYVVDGVVNDEKDEEPRDEL